MMSLRRSAARNESRDERRVRQKPREAGMSGYSGGAVSGGASPLDRATRPSSLWQSLAAWLRICCKISSWNGSGGLVSILVIDWTSFNSTISLYIREFSLPCCVPEI